MSTVKILNDDQISIAAKNILDDIKNTRKTEYINNFWRALANNPETLKRTWESMKQIMGEGAIDQKTKEMIYLAVSVAHNCPYCIHSHTVAAKNKGMSEDEYNELIAIIGMTSETNRLATALGIPIDDCYLV